MDFMPVVYAALVLGIIGTLFGIILNAASKKFTVETDPRWEQIRSVLGGANCGACGFSGCNVFAQAVIDGEAKPNGCPIGGEKAASRIAEIMGVELPEKKRMVARIICQGREGVVKRRYEYDGYRSCSTAVTMAGGPKLCSFSCAGLGDCTKFCVFDAIKLKDGMASVDETRCVGCGNCARHCPRNAIRIMPADAKVVVLCRNSDSGRVARNQCMKACIACGRCVKECKYGAITVNDGYATIDQDKCTRCGACAKVCPSWAIVDFSVGGDYTYTRI